MKYYDEDKMAEIQKTLEKEILKWKGVTSRPMMGCLCYFYNRKFIGFLVTNDIVLMKQSDKDQKEIKEKFGGRPFEMAGQTGRLWVTPLNGPKDVKSVMPFVRKRYEEVFSTSAKTQFLNRKTMDCRCVLPDEGQEGLRSVGYLLEKR